MDLTDSTPKKRPLPQRELKSLQSQLSALEKQTERLRTKSETSSIELAKAKAGLEAKEKELSLTRKNFAKVIDQKQSLEAALEDCKLQLRRFESGLSLKRAPLPVQVENRGRDGSVEELRKELQGRSDQIAVLTQALKIKAEEMGLDGDMRSSLLYDIGQCREELAQQSVLLLQSQSLIQSLKDQLRTAHINIEELKLIRESNNDELNALERTVAQLTGEKKQLVTRNEELAEERLSLLDYVEELKGTVRDREEREEQAERMLAEQVRKNVSLGADLQSRAMEKDVHIEETQLKYQQALDTIQELDHELAKMRRQLGDVLREEEAARQRSQSQEGELEENRILLENCQASLSTLQQAYSRLTTDKESADSRYQDLEKRYKDVLRSLDETKSKQNNGEQLLKERLEKTLIDLEELVDERDQLREAMNDAINRCAAAMMAQQNLQGEMEKRQKQVDTLIASKALLQKTMSDQVNTLKIQLDSLRREKAQFTAS